MLPNVTTQPQVVIGSGLKFGQVEVSQSDPNSVRTFKDIQGLNRYDRAL